MNKRIHRYTYIPYQPNAICQLYRDQCVEMSEVYTCFSKKLALILMKISPSDDKTFDYAFVFNLLFYEKVLYI